MDFRTLEKNWDQLYEHALSLVKIEDLARRKDRIESEFLGLLYLGYADVISKNYFIGVKNETWERDPGSKNDVAYDASVRRCFCLQSTELLNRRAFVYVTKDQKKGEHLKNNEEHPKINKIYSGPDMEKRGDADCKNQIQKYIKRKQNSEECKDVHVIETSAGVGADRDLIEEALSKIESKYRQAIRLKYYEGKTQAEVAQIMDVGVATVSDWVGEKGLKIAFKELKKAIAEILEHRKDTNE